MTLEAWLITIAALALFAWCFWPLVGQRIAAYRREREADDYLRTNLRERLSHPPQMLTTGPLTPHDYAARAATLAKSPEVFGTSSGGVTQARGLEAWAPSPEAMKGPCKNGCCNGPYCIATYRKSGAAASVAEAFPQSRDKSKGGK